MQKGSSLAYGEGQPAGNGPPLEGENLTIYRTYPAARAPSNHSQPCPSPRGEDLDLPSCRVLLQSPLSHYSQKDFPTVRPKSPGGGVLMTAAHQEGRPAGGGEGSSLRRRPMGSHTRLVRHPEGSPADRDDSRVRTSSLIIGAS